MKNDPTHPLRLLSALLQYPDQDMLSQVESIAAEVEGMPSNELKECMAAFLGYLEAHPLIHLQEGYTAAFDMNPSTTLNLTYHIHGDNEHRSALLAQLQQRYQDAGYERTTGELPDYLPLMLEFLSVCPDAAHTKLIWECLSGLEDYVDRLEKTAPAYANLLQPLANLAAARPGHRPEDASPIEADTLHGQSR